MVAQLAKQTEVITSANILAFIWSPFPFHPPCGTSESSARLRKAKGRACEPGPACPEVGVRTLRPEDNIPVAGEAALQAKALQHCGEGYWVHYPLLTAPRICSKRFTGDGSDLLSDLLCPIFAWRFTETDTQLEMLKTMLAEHQKKLGEAEAIVRHEQPICSNLRNLIQALESGDTPATAAPPQPGGTIALTRLPRTLPINGRALPRHPQFRLISVAEAAERVLRANKLPMHANDLTRAIFAVEGAVDFARAKNALVGDLVRGIERGRFERTGKNEFGLRGGQ